MKGPKKISADCIFIKYGVWGGAKPTFFHQGGWGLASATPIPCMLIEVLTFTSQTSLASKQFIFDCQI